MIDHLITLAAEEAAAQLDDLNGEPVACVFLIFDANGRCTAGSAVLPEHLETLVNHLSDAATSVQDGLREQLAELHQSAEGLTALAIQKARTH